MNFFYKYQASNNNNNNNVFFTRDLEKIPPLILKMKSVTSYRTWSDCYINIQNNDQKVSENKHGPSSLAKGY